MKITASDRDVEQTPANTDPLKLKFHDFDSLPFLKGVYHGQNSEGHHFICNGEPILVSAEAKQMKTVNKGLSVIAKGRLVTIHYLGRCADYEEIDGEKVGFERGAYEVTDVEATA